MTNSNTEVKVRGAYRVLNWAHTVREKLEVHGLPTEGQGISDERIAQLHNLVKSGLLEFVEGGYSPQSVVFTDKGEAALQAGWDAAEQAVQSFMGIDN